MNCTANITSESFFIDGTKINVRLIQPEDKSLSRDFARRLATEANQFHTMGGFHQLSESDLEKLCDSKSIDAVGVIALLEKNEKKYEVGVARYVKSSLTGSYEMAVTVSDKYKRTRLANELIGFLALSALRNNIALLYMVDRDSNVDVRNLAEELKMSVRLDPVDAHKVIYTLNVREHQGHGSSYSEAR